MSREFRYVSSAYFDNALAEASQEKGSHEISIILAEMYGILSEIESGCASFEASDSGDYRPRLALQDNFKDLEAVTRKLGLIYNRDCEFIARALQEREKKTNEFTAA